MKYLVDATVLGKPPQLSTVQGRYLVMLVVAKDGIEPPPPAFSGYHYVIIELNVVVLFCLT
jgi:hypothetical protein